MFFLATTPAFAGSGNNSTGDWIVGLLLLAFLFLVYKTILFVVRKLGLSLPTNVITHGSPIVVLLGAFFVLSLGNGLIDIAIALKSLSNINTYLPFLGSDVKSAAQIAIEQGLISSQFNTSPEIEELLGSCGLAKILSNVVFIVVLAFAAVQIYGVRKVGKVKRDTLLNLQIIGSAIVILAVLFDFYVLNEVLDVILPLRDKNNASFLVIFAIGFVIAFHVFRSYSEKTAEIFGITVEEQPQTEEATTTEAESEQEVICQRSNVYPSFFALFESKIFLLADIPTKEQRAVYLNELNLISRDSLKTAVKSSKMPKKEKISKAFRAEDQRVESDIQRALGVKVKVNRTPNSNSGKLILEFYTDDDFQVIYRKLMSDI